MKSPTINPYDEMVKNPPESFKEYFREEERFVRKNISKNDVVLDLGCGAGRVTKIIAEIAKEIIGIDNDETAVNKGRENIKKFKNAKIILEDAEKTSFEDKKFDIIFCGLSFVNFGKTKFNILREIKRILKDNGKFIFSVYNENSLDERLRIYNKFDPRKVIVDKSGNISFDAEAVSEKFSEKEINEILSAEGFKISKIIKGGIFYLIEAKKK